MTLFGMWESAKRTHGMNEPFSDFSYSLDTDKKRLAIIDMNKGKMSVTNDIERVLSYISKKHATDITDFNIWYLDTDNKHVTVSILNKDMHGEITKVKFKDE